MPDDTDVPTETPAPRPASTIHRELADALEKFEADVKASTLAQSIAAESAKLVTGLKSELATIEADAEGLFARAVKFVESL